MIGAIIAMFITLVFVDVGVNDAKTIDGLWDDACSSLEGTRLANGDCVDSAVVKKAVDALKQ